MPSSLLKTQFEENKTVIQWNRFTIFNRLVNTMANVLGALGRNQPATLAINFEERLKAKAINFKLLQQEKFGEEIRFLKVNREIQILKFSLFHHFWTKEDLFMPQEKYAEVNWTSRQSIQYSKIGNNKGWKYSCVTFFEPRVFYLCKLFFREWVKTKMKSIHFQQATHKTTYTWTISSNRWENRKNQLKSSIS